MNPPDESPLTYVEPMLYFCSVPEVGGGTAASAALVVAGKPLSMLTRTPVALPERFRHSCDARSSTAAR